jgi:hypothetical protein
MAFAMAFAFLIAFLIVSLVVSLVVCAFLIAFANAVALVFPQNSRCRTAAVADQIAYICLYPRKAGSHTDGYKFHTVGHK